MIDKDNLIYWAWTIITNASQGNWENETPEWQMAAADWRDDFYKMLAEKNIEDFE
jgi:hypothetical protein